MLLIDDILLSPCKGLLWVFEEIHNNAVEELEGQAERIRNELTDLYMMLETGQIEEDEFDQRESALLDRLDQLEAEGLADDEDEEQDEDEDEDDEIDVDAVTMRVFADDAETRTGAGRGRVLETED